MTVGLLLEQNTGIKYNRETRKLSEIKTIELFSFDHMTSLDCIQDIQSFPFQCVCDSNLNCRILQTTPEDSVNWALKNIPQYTVDLFNDFLTHAIAVSSTETTTQQRFKNQWLSTVGGRPGWYNFKIGDLNSLKCDTGIFNRVHLLQYSIPVEELTNQPAVYDRNGTPYYGHQYDQVIGDRDVLLSFHTRRCDKYSKIYAINEITFNLTAAGPSPIVHNFKLTEVN